MKKIYYSIHFAIAAIFFIMPQANAQRHEGIIKGKIVTSDGKAAASVTIELQGMKRLTFSNNDGLFVFNHLPAFRDTLIISSAESEVYTQGIHLMKNQHIDLGIIRLKKTIPQLQTVEIEGRTKQSYKSDYSFFVNKTETPLINIPQSVSTVTKELIRDKMALNLKDVVDVMAGVNQYSGYDEYTIRGFRAENSRNINGLRGYNTTYTNSMLLNIERVEIIKGPVSTLYGNGDPGGTINLVTKKPLKEEKSEINIFGGSWSHFRVSGDNTGHLNKKKTLLYRINAGYDNRQSFRSDIFSRSYQVAPSLSFIPNDKISLNFDFSISHINTVLDRGQPGIMDDPDLLATPIKLSLSQPGDYLNETDLASVISFSYKINNHFSYNLGYLNYITRQGVADHGLKDYITNDSVGLYFTQWDYHTVTNTLSNYFSYKFNSGRINHQLVAGYDYIQSEVNLDQDNYKVPDQFGLGSGVVGTFSLRKPVYFRRPVKSYKLSDEDADETEVDANVYHTQGIYIQDQISLNRWKLLVGLREEFYKGEGEDEDDEIDQRVFLPRIGLVYSIKNNLSAYATYNKGFDPFEASGETQVFDAPIKPQISELFETGLKGNFFAGKLSATLALYQLTVQNVAVNANQIGNPDLFVQEGQVRSKGIELEADGNITSNLGVSWSYAYCDAKITKSKTASQIGTRLENAPLNSGSSWIKYNFRKGTLKGFGIAAGHSQVSYRRTLDPEIDLPGYVIINGTIQYTFKNFTLALKAENITNKTYWIGAYNNVSKWPGEPRNFMLNFRYSF
ncbi:MAG: TonB-dependent receptor [Ginsengibacter sp.]